MKNSTHIFRTSLCAALVATTLTISGCLQGGLQSSKPGTYRVQVSTYTENGLGVARKIEKQLDGAGYDAYLVKSKDKHVLYIGNKLSHRKAASVKKKADKLVGANSLIISH